MKNLHTRKTSNGSNFGWLIRQMSINQKSGRQTFRRRFVSGSLFASPCPPECNFQSETKIKPDLRLVIFIISVRRSVHRVLILSCLAKETLYLVTKIMLNYIVLQLVKITQLKLDCNCNVNVNANVNMEFSKYFFPNLQTEIAEVNMSVRCVADRCSNAGYPN